MARRADAAMPEKIMNTELRRPRNPGRIVGGIAVVLVGLSMLADQIGYDDGLHLSTRYWPLILIAIGVVRLAEVSGPDGQADIWGVEMNSPNNLVKQGWRSNTVKAGDKVSVVISPLRSGELRTAR